MTDLDIALAVVGTMVPDSPAYHGPAFNRAAQMFQKELVCSVAKAGMPASVFSFEPIPAFPRSRRLLVKGSRWTLPGGLTVRNLPFLNILPLKPITAGLALVAVLLPWGWRHRRQPRIVHCVNLTMPPGFFVWLGARLIGAKVTVSLLDVFRPGQLVPNRLYWRMDYWMQKRMIPHFDGHAVVSDAIVHDFAPGRRVCRIEGGVRPEVFEMTAREAADAAVDRQPALFRAVLAGSLEPYNGVELALGALSRLPPTGFELVIAGTGSLAAGIRKASGDDPRIVYLGFLEFADVLKLYRTADVLLNVRLTEAIDTRYFFPSKVMEFMASGTPVVSTCTGHIESEFGELVYLLRDETPAGLAALLQTLAALSRAERLVRGRRARAYILANKTWDQQAGKLVQYFRSVVGVA